MLINFIDAFKGFVSSNYSKALSALDKSENGIGNAMDKMAWEIKTNGKGRLFLGLAFGLTFGGFLFAGCKGEKKVENKVAAADSAISNKVATAVDDASSKVTTAASGAMAALGKFFSFKLPNGLELNIPENGVENKLIGFINDKSKLVDKKTWFSFDRLKFDTGAETLKPESQEQLKNIAEIMKAYPNVQVKIGGYTDNVGDAQANQALSTKRANNVMGELVKLGVDQARLKAEGYGQANPVASNDTKEGKAKNRRIAIRVTKK